MSVLPKGYDCMSRQTSSECVWCTRVIIECHTRPHPTMCAAHGPCRHATPYVVQLCVQSKGDDNILCRPCLIVYAFQNDDGMPRPILSDCVCCTKEMMACHARRSLIASIAQWWWWHAMPDVIRSSLLPKGHGGMPRPTSSNYLCSPIRMMAFQVDVVRCVLSKVRLWHVKPDVLRPM